MNNIRTRTTPVLQTKNLFIDLSVPRDFKIVCPTKVVIIK